MFREMKLLLLLSLLFGGRHKGLEDASYLFAGEEVRARARFWRDQKLLDRANAMPLSSCDALERIANRG